MDLNAIKAKLEEMNTSGNNNNDREKIDYEKVFWRPTPGKHQLRIVPSVFEPTFPFKELKFHYGIGKYPMIALSNFGKQDPIEEFCKELRKTSDRDNWSLAGKITPKTRIFAPVVVRGEEDMGVRLWGFGKTIYKALLALAEDEDIGDYTDVVNGFDLVVEQVQGNPYPETSVRIKPKMTPLSDDNTLVETWLKVQPNPEESFTQYDYEFVKRQLQNYLSPDSATDEESDDSPVSTSSFTLKDNSKPVAEVAEAPVKEDVVSKFDDLFN